MSDLSAFAEFLATCSDIELIGLQSDARKANDAESLKVIMEELGRRHKAMLAKAGGENGS